MNDIAYIFRYLSLNVNIELYDSKMQDVRINNSAVWMLRGISVPLGRIFNFNNNHVWGSYNSNTLLQYMSNSLYFISKNNKELKILI